jgi:hypothetical protein
MAVELISADNRKLTITAVKRCKGPGGATLVPGSHYEVPFADGKFLVATGQAKEYVVPAEPKGAKQLDK